MTRRPLKSCPPGTIIRYRPDSVSATVSITVCGLVLLNIGNEGFWRPEADLVFIEKEVQTDDLHRANRK